MCFERSTTQRHSVSLINRVCCNAICCTRFNRFAGAAINNRNNSTTSKFIGADQRRQFFFTNLLSPGRCRIEHTLAAWSMAVEWRQVFFFLRSIDLFARWPMLECGAAVYGAPIGPNSATWSAAGARLDQLSKRFVAWTDAVSFNWHNGTFNARAWCIIILNLMASASLWLNLTARWHHKWLLGNLYVTKWWFF